MITKVLSIGVTRLDLYILVLAKEKGIATGGFYGMMSQESDRREYNLKHNYTHDLSVIAVNIEICDACVFYGKDSHYSDHAIEWCEHFNKPFFNNPLKQELQSYNRVFFLFPRDTALAEFEELVIQGVLTDLLP